MRVENGDVMWTMIENALGETGYKPTDAIVNPITLWTAEESGIAHPSSLSKGDLLEKPTKPVLDIFVNAMTTKNHSSDVEQIYKDMMKLNNSPKSIEKLLATEQPTLNDMSNHLQLELQNRQSQKQHFEKKKLPLAM